MEEVSLPIGRRGESYHLQHVYRKLESSVSLFLSSVRSRYVHLLKSFFFLCVYMYLLLFADYVNLWNEIPNY